jgi:lysophospholipase L1-like esterase
MKALQLLLISVVMIASCKKQGNNALKADTSKTVVAPPDTGIYHYLALGDSYTIGTSVQPDQSYPVQLISAMNAAGLSTPNPTIIAADGWTTDVLIHAIANSNISGNKYQVVTLLIGVNDQYEGATQDHYRANFIQLLHSAINFAGGDSTRVFVLSIPDYGVTPYAMGRDSIIGPQIDAFNAINKQESTNVGVNYLNVTDISREAANDTTLIASDGLHPSYKMYKLWIDQLAPMVIARMEKH